MASSEHHILTRVHCGWDTFHITQLKGHSRMDDIHNQVRRHCGPHLPPFFHLKFYHGARRIFVTLNEDQLDDECSPFRIAAHDLNPTSVVELYVVDIAGDFEVNDARSSNDKILIRSPTYKLCCYV
jgi:hypothetical protein